MSGTTLIFNEKMQNKLTKNDFRNRLVQILNETNISNAKIIANNFVDMVYKELPEISEQDNFVEALIKGNAHRKLINIDSLFRKKNITITISQKSKIHDLIQLILANELNEYRTFEYVMQNLPIMSFFKKELLEIRPGTNIPQWKFINDNCLDKSNSIELYFRNIANYKEISDKLCATAVSALVKKMTGKRFDSTISQKGKGWYPNGLDALPEQLHNIKPYYLFLFAYSFRLNFQKYDEMRNKNEDTYDCFCFEENIFRFAIAYIRRIDEIPRLISIIDENKEDFIKAESKNYDAEYVTEEINSFFSKNTGNIESLYPSFSALLKKLGVVSAKKREETLNEQRRIVAQNNMHKLIEDTDQNNIIKYCSLLHSSADDIISFKYKTDIESAEKAINILHDNYLQLFEAKPEEKAKILSMLCDRISPDSSNMIRPSIRPVLKSKFTTTHIRKINTGTTNKPITRSDILKIGYLRTFIDFVNENNDHFKNKQEMTEATRKLKDQFEATTNKMLKECYFAPVKITFALDGLIEIALSSGMNDKCIPEVFQACLPIDITRIVK